MKGIKIFARFVAFTLVIMPLMILITKIPDPTSQKEAIRLQVLIKDSIHSRHVIRRQNEMILGFKEYGVFYVKKENNCFTRK